MKSIAEAIAFSALTICTGALEYSGSNVDWLWIIIVLWVVLSDWGR